MSFAAISATLGSAVTIQPGELRVRLEGRLERLERARLEFRALEVLFDDRWPRRLPWQVERIHLLVAGLADIDEALLKAEGFEESRVLVKSVREARGRLESFASAAWQSLGESPAGLSLDALLMKLLERAPVDIGHSASAAGWYVGFTIFAVTASLALSQSWPVIAGCAVAIIASLVAWYFSPRRIWELRTDGIVIRTPEPRALPFSVIERVDQSLSAVVIHHTEEGVRVQESLDCDAPSELAALLALYRARKVPRARARHEDCVVVATRFGEVTGTLLAFSRGAFFVHQSNALRGFEVPPKLLLQELALMTDDALEKLGSVLDAGEFWRVDACALLPRERPDERALRVGPMLIIATVTPEENLRLERWFQAT